MKKSVYLLALLLCCFTTGLAQIWLPGYSYRKKITVDKSKVVAINVNAGSTVVKQDLPDFPLLIEIQHPDLVHISGSCSNKIRNIDGKDIAFALSTNPQIPLNFQLEHYDPVKGKIVCWVKVALLSANGTASSPSSLYFYYGSTTLHTPLGTEALDVWSGNFNRIWHLNRTEDAVSSPDAQSGLLALAASGGTGTFQNNFKEAKIGPGIELDGSAQWFHSASDTSTSVTLSAWINLNKLGSEQVIVANDSINADFRNGYVLKITPEGKPGIDVYRSKTRYSIIGLQTFETGKWYHLIATIASNQAFITVNGIKTISQSLVRMGGGGQIKIGASKQNTSFFNGKLDEIRLMKTIQTLEFLKTEYVNQENPSQFYTVLEEEYSPSDFFKFTGPNNGSWTLGANWSKGSIPGIGSNVVIPAGKSVRINGPSPVIIEKLILQTGSFISIGHSAEISCLVQLDVNSDLKLDNGVKLKLDGDLINNGRISLNQSSGTLLFAGSNAVQSFSGSGNALVYGVENDQSSSANKLLLEASLQVSGFINAKRGILSVNDNLTLLASSNHAASVLPVRTEQATIFGQVRVQHYLNGPYAAPSTARSWRLLSSPVYHSTTPKKHTISAFKNSMFITGPGGTQNGFDPSPLNGGTVYTHNQALPGSLSQKYIPISNTEVSIPLGRGVYVFSRGSKNVPNAFLEQIQQSPFSNPSGYYLTHAGNLYTGDLELLLDNKNSGSDGDGFHLLGNPYASDITWGAISKDNLVPFVWLYDPINKDYSVSDDLLTIIPSGSGFFAKVKTGFVSGSLKFLENSKNIDTLDFENSLSNKISTVSSDKAALKRTAFSGTAHAINQTFDITLSRGNFSQQYRVSFETAGNDNIDDNDALKIGEGFVNLASITGNTKLSIEQRGPINEKKELQLYVAGWETGSYKLTLSYSEALKKTAAIKLTDHYLNLQSTVNSQFEEYPFDINITDPASQGINRFSISLVPIEKEITAKTKEKEIITYPNPFSDRLYIKSSFSANDLIIRFTDLQGRKTAFYTTKDGSNDPYIDCSVLQKGFYLVSIYKRNSMVVLKTIKIFKK